MKIFIVSLVFIMLFMSFTVYAADMNAYIQLQKEMKAMAEECAAGAALQLAPESFQTGRIKIDAAAAQSYADKVIEETAVSGPPPAHGTLSASARLISDDCIEVTVTYTADPGYDLFRLPFLSRTAAVRRAAYRWEP